MSFSVACGFKVNTLSCRGKYMWCELKDPFLLTAKAGNPGYFLYPCLRGPVLNWFGATLLLRASVR